MFILFDIDNTLYKYSETGFDNEMHERIFKYAMEKVGLSYEEAREISLKYHCNYGISLLGYVRHHGVDAKDYSDYVHQCSYHTLRPNKPLIEMLGRLRYHHSPEGNEVSTENGYHGGHHLYYFTNGNRSHARQILEPLGLKALFTRARPASSPVDPEHVLDDPAGVEEDVEWQGFSYEDQWRLTKPEVENKPMRRAYEAIYHAIDAEVARDEQFLKSETAAQTNSPVSPCALAAKHKRLHLSPENIIFVDDSLMNMDAPIELGWKVVWYAHGKPLPDTPLYADAMARGQMRVIQDIMEIERVVQEFESASEAMLLPS